MGVGEDLYVQRQLGKCGLPVRELIPMTESIVNTYKEHSVDIVHISVLPTVIMNIILWHRNLRAIEYRGLQYR